jgi:hypothetical protein
MVRIEVTVDNSDRLPDPLADPFSGRTGAPAKGGMPFLCRPTLLEQMIPPPRSFILGEWRASTSVLRGMLGSIKERLLNGLDAVFSVLVHCSRSLLPTADSSTAGT